jgi:phage terminase large subunit-like protein
MNWIRLYNDKLVSGEIVACQKVKKVYAKLVADMDVGGEFLFSEARAQHAIDFIERFCKHSKGKWGGQPVRLELWEKAFISAIFGFIDIEGRRKYREALLIVGKKNGKSLLASGIGLYMMVADGEPGADVYAVATKRDQAKIIWGEAVRMVKKSPTLAQRIKCRVGDMVSDLNESSFRPLASDSDTLDGLNVQCALMDEIHQWKNGRALYDIIADGVSAREQPLILITTTAGTIREDIYDEKYEYSEKVINGYGDPDGYKDEQFLPVIYELDDRAEWTDERCWIKANPGLGTIKSLDTLRKKVAKARENPQLVKNLVCKEFNIRETSASAWLAFDVLNNTARFDIDALAPRYGFGGVDLSKTTDLTAACVIFRVPGDPHIYVLIMFWLPAELLEQRVREDKIPYDIWEQQGLVRLCPGNAISYRMVADWFEEVQNELGITLINIGYDAWSARYFVEDLESRFGPTVPVPVIQGKKTLSTPMQNLGANLKGKIIVYNNHPILKWNLANTAVDEDKNGNIQPIKTSKPTRRIDGTAALLDACVVYENELEYYETLL